MGNAADFRLLQQAHLLNPVRRAPDRGEDGAGFLQGSAVGEQEQAVTVSQPRTGINERFDPLRACGDRKHAETAEAEAGAVDVLHPCCLVCEHLAVKGSLGETSAHGGHCSSVSLKEKESHVALTVRLFNVQREHTVWHDAKLAATSDFHSPPKRCWQSVVDAANRNLLANEEPDAAGLSPSEFNGHHHVGNQKGMLKVNTADRPVLLLPTDWRKTGPKFVTENCCPFATQAIHDMAGAGEVIPVELGAGALKKVVVVKQLEAAEELLRAAAQKRRDIRACCAIMRDS